MQGHVNRQEKEEKEALYKERWPAYIKELRTRYVCAWGKNSDWTAEPTMYLKERIAFRLNTASLAYFIYYPSNFNVL